MCTVHTDFLCMWNHIHYIAQELSAFTNAICSIITKFLEIVFIHIKVIMSEKGNTRDTGENLVALREQHNGVCSVSKLIASCLSLVLRRKKVKENVADTLNVNSRHGFYRHLFKIVICIFLTQDSCYIALLKKHCVYLDWIFCHSFINK